MASGRPIQREPEPSTAAARSVSMEDLEFINKIRAGQTEAYGDLVRKYEDRVFNTCWRICGHLEDARDVTQEAFLKAYEGLSGFRRDSGFYTWIFRIAVNLALTKRRDAARRRTTSLDEAAGSLGTQARDLVLRASPQNDPGSDEVTENHGRLVSAIHDLEPDYRSVVVLRDIEGMDYETIAGILDIPTGTVKSRLHRARVILSTALQPAKARRN